MPRIAHNIQRKYDCGLMSCTGVVDGDMGYPIIERGRIFNPKSVPQVWGIWIYCPRGEVRRGREVRHGGEGRTGVKGRGRQARRVS